MAQYTQDYYFIKIDMAGYLTEHSTATYRELMQYICQEMQENFNEDCEYTEVPSGSQNYPAIRIPWHDGSTTNMPILILSKDATAAAANSSSAFTIYFHTSGLGNSSYDLCTWYGTKTGGNDRISTNPTTNKFVIGAVKESDMMHIGFYVEGTSSTSATIHSVVMNTIMTKMKDRKNNTDKHALIAVDWYTDMNKNYVDIAIEDEGFYWEWQPSNFQTYNPSDSSTHTRSGVALITPIDIGTHYHETLHVYPRTCSSLRGEWDTDTSFYDTTPEDAWYEEAFVVDGVAWDVKRYSSRGFSYGFSICKKHVLEG